MKEAQPSTPTISRVLDDGSLIELLYDPSTKSTALVLQARDGSTPIKQEIELPSGERLVPLFARNNLLETECVLLPSEVGSYTSKAALLDQVLGFLHRYVDLPEPFDAIAAYYVLLTWVYDAFTDLPYLRFKGDFGTGKTRALLVLGSIAYKGFFASGASTVSPIFHIQDAFQGTLILDEADLRMSDQTAQLVKILNNGSTRGLPVLRTMTTRNRELHPQAFRVFGPKIVAMRERFSDLALESRFITVDMSGRSLRADVPIHLPASFADEARILRNSLLAWRLSSRFSVGPDPLRQAAGVSARYRQSSWALLSLVDDAALRDRIGRELAGVEACALQERADTIEAAVLAALVTSFETTPGPGAPIKIVTDRFNDALAADLGRPMSTKWVSGIIRRKLGITPIRTGGVYVVPPSARAKVTALAKRFGIERAP